jgi:hypothetical protein
VAASKAAGEDHYPKEGDNYLKRVMETGALERIGLTPFEHESLRHQRALFVDVVTGSFRPVLSQSDVHKNNAQQWPERKRHFGSFGS